MSAGIYTLTRAAPSRSSVSVTKFLFHFGISFPIYAIDGSRALEDTRAFQGPNPSALWDRRTLSHPL